MTENEERAWLECEPDLERLRKYARSKLPAEKALIEWCADEIERLREENGAGYSESVTLRKKLKILRKERDEVKEEVEQLREERDEAKEAVGSLLADSVELSTSLKTEKETARILRAEIERLRGSLQKIHRLLESEFGGFYLSAPPAEALGKIRLIMMAFDTERLTDKKQADNSDPGGEG